MSGADIAAKVARGIAKAGAKTGNGTPLRGVILRRGPDDMTTRPPTPGPTYRYACTLFLSQYSARDRDGTNITERDMKAMIAADAEVEPHHGDRIEVAGRTLSLLSVTPYMPGGTVLYYQVQARAGE